MNIFTFIKQHRLATLFVIIAAGLVFITVQNRLDTNVQGTGTTELPAVSLITAKDYQEQKTIAIENGSVQSLNQADLKAQMTAQIIAVSTKLGDSVSTGQVLLQLQNSDIKAQLEQAQARLDELKKGARPEDLALSQTAANEAKSALINSIDDAYAKSDDAIHNHIDKFFANPRQSNAQFMITANVGASQVSLQATDTALAKVIAGQKYGLEAMFGSWQSTLRSINQSSSDTEIESAVALAQANLQKQIDFLNDMAPLVNGLSNDNATYKQIIDGYKTEFSAARSTLNGSLAGLQGTETAWRSARQALDLKLAGASNEQIRQAQASVDALRATLARTSIVSPLSGKISYINGRVGELASAGTLVATVVNPGGLQVKSYASESDLPQISIGDAAMIDGGAVGMVSAVSPAVDPQSKKGEVDIVITK
ncbi:MAG: HlyD family efflux transporter periplasmic adaptor subunit, partial [Candidatus Pacebacteria bacterium]|nr:HlyD family efflux transporter periplasmic adaptor subunit [Candidatus Paceibacterota bacterium]